MFQGIATPLSRQLETYRHQAVAAPSILEMASWHPLTSPKSWPKKDFKGATGFFPLISPYGRFCCKCSAPMAPAGRRSVACALG